MEITYHIWPCYAAELQEAIDAIQSIVSALQERDPAAAIMLLAPFPQVTVTKPSCDHHVRHECHVSPVCNVCNVCPMCNVCSVCNVSKVQYVPYSVRIQLNITLIITVCVYTL